MAASRRRRRRPDHPKADVRGRGDLTTIQTTDPMCYGVTGTFGERYDTKDGRITLPRREAEKILRSGHPEVAPYRPTAGGWYRNDGMWGPDGRLRRTGPEED